MKKELADKLFEKYPKIFVQKDLDMTQTAMCWGLQCGDGWYTLLDCLCSELQILADEGESTYKKYNPLIQFFGKLFGNPKIMGKWIRKDLPQVEATTVKEKFGGLRFYYTGYSKQADALIEFVEILSYRTCEVCGTTTDVKQTTDGWINTVCKNCVKEHIV